MVIPGLKLDRLRIPWGFAILAAAVFAAYFPALRAGFVWDDNSVLTGNPLIQASDGLYRFWSTTQATDYWPVSSSSLWLEWRLWGPSPLGYHATNLVLHLASCCLLWAVLWCLRTPGAFLAALLFAVHPVNVESVAWIAERKNLLAMVFALISTYAYLRVERADPSALDRRQPDVPLSALGSGRSTWYAVSLSAFILALLSKGSVAVLPFALLGIMLWRRAEPAAGGWARLAPYFLAGAVFAFVNVWFQKHLLTEAIRQAGPADRLAGAGLVPWFYLSKAVWPFDLAFVYPRLTIAASDPVVWLPALAAVGLTVFLWRRSRPAFFAWAFYCAMLAPVLGLTDIYFQRYSLVADHYQHLALPAVAALAAAAWTWWRRGSDWPALALVCGLGVLTWRECRDYRDAETLYHSILRANPAASLALNNLGNLLLHSGRAPEAIALYEDELRRAPGDSDAHNNLGNAFLQQGRIPEAIAELRAALRIRPGLEEAHYNLANALVRSGGESQAGAEYEAALRLDPRDFDAHSNYGVLLLSGGRAEAAAAQFEAALRIRPGVSETEGGLGAALLQSGRAAEAAEAFTEAVRLDPGNLAARNNLGNLLLQAGRVDEAVAQFREVLRRNPRSAEAHTNLGNVLFGEKRTEEAIGEYRAAIAANPDYAQAHHNLAVACFRTGRREEAVAEFAAALRLDPNSPAAARDLRRAETALRRSP